MSLPIQQTVMNYIGNGITTAFPYICHIWKSSDLIVSVGGVTLSGANYTVSGIGTANGGSVTFFTAPGNGATVTITRQLPLTRDTSYITAGDFRATTVNSDQDYQTALIQQEDRDRIAAETQLRAELYGLGLAVSTVNLGMVDNLEVAVSTFGAASGTITIATTQVLTGNLTLHAGLVLRIMKPAVITIPAGITLTINSPFECGVFQVFNCEETGRVTGLEFGIPQHFGAYSDGTNGAITATAIQKAVDASMGNVYFSAGRYLISNTIYYQSNANFTGEGRCGSAWVNGSTVDQAGGVALIAASGITMFQTLDTVGPNPTGLIYSPSFNNLSFYVAGKTAGDGTYANYLSGAVAIDITGTAHARIQRVDFHSFDKAVLARAEFFSAHGDQYTKQLLVDDFTAQECGTVVYLADAVNAGIKPHADISIINSTCVRFCGKPGTSQFYIHDCDGIGMTDITIFPSFDIGIDLNNTVNIRLGAITIFEGMGPNLNINSCYLLSASNLILMRAGWTNLFFANNINITDSQNICINATCERPRGSNVNILNSYDVALFGSFTGAFYGIRTGSNGQSIYIDSTSHNISIHGNINGLSTDAYEPYTLPCSVNAAGGSYGITGCLAADVPGVNAPDMVIVRATGGTGLMKPTASSSTASAGGASALPVTPSGYITVVVLGSTVKIPYYGL